MHPSPNACRTEEIRESDIGTRAGLFEVVKIGDEFFSFIVDCEAPKACTILLRGASKDILNEVRFMFELSTGYGLYVGCLRCAPASKDILNEVCALSTENGTFSP